jgi:MarR family transcriptional regulator, organic hydroperoxide resistance regulator
MPEPEPARDAYQPSDELRYLILAAQREGSRQFAARLRSASLTPAQAEVLEVLRDRAPLTLAELGRLLVCETGSPSRLVDGLVRRDLVTRMPGLDDRRVVALALTPAGYTAIAAASGAAIVRDIIASRLARHEVEQLAGLLRRLLAGTAGGEAVAARFPGSADR